LAPGGVRRPAPADDLRFDRRRWAPFWSAFIHVLRNAIDHGIEPPDEREALGKPRAGRLALRAGHAGDQVVIEIGDDGRGIDWKAVSARAQDLGRPADSEEQLRDALFSGGISTREAVSEISGRGAGMAACKAACDALGGRIQVATQIGQGTTFRFIFPVGAHTRPATPADSSATFPLGGTAEAKSAPHDRGGQAGARRDLLG